MNLTNFLELGVVERFAIVLVLSLLVGALIEFVKFCVWYHDHRKGKF